jgi:OFA family oxalate/formate antiporter-like MFS transporter
MLFAGIIYAWSILKAPFGEEFGWTPGQLAVNFTLTMSFFCVGGILSGIIGRRIGFRKMMVFGAMLSGIGFVLISKISSLDIHFLYMAYGVMAGAGIGMAYNSILSTVSMWFPDKKGLCSGVLMMGFGGSALVLGSVAGKMLSDPAIGWRTTYQLLGIFIIVVIVASAAIIKVAPSDISARISKNVTNGKLHAEKSGDFTVKEMVKTKIFVKFFILSVALSAIGTTVISFAKDYATDLGAAATLSTVLVGVLSIFNGVGRIMSGIIFDLLGHPRTIIISSLIAVIASFAILTGALTGALTIGVIGLCLTGLSYGFVPTLTATYTRTWFGDKWFASNFSIMTISLIPASFMATLSGQLYSSTNSFIISTTALAVSGMIALILGINIGKYKG